MTENKEKLMITPDTKVFELLEAYPELEDTLIEMAPAFKKLKNPILRKTVARITSLRQAAKIGELELGELINRFRKEVGISEEFETDEDYLSDSSGKPKWFDELKIVKKLDARPMLEDGEHPVGIVLQEVKELGAGEIYQLITPFLPEPLLDKVNKAGFKIWTEKVGEEYRSYFIRNNGKS
jgi:uncharacterized protein (DUF2249 family)